MTTKLKHCEWDSHGYVLSLCSRRDNGAEKEAQQRYEPLTLYLLCGWTPRYSAHKLELQLLRFKISLFQSKALSFKYLFWCKMTWGDTTFDPYPGNQGLHGRSYKTLGAWPLIVKKKFTRGWNNGIVIQA